MKKFTFIKFLMMIAMAICLKPASAQLLLQDNFNYSGALTANGWTAHSQAGTNAINTAALSLSYANYVASAIGNMAVIDTTGEDVNKTFAPVSSGSVYVSFLVNVQKAKATGDYFLNLGQTAMGTTFKGRVYVKYDSGSGKIAFGVSKSSNTPSYTAFSYDFNTTYLLVLKYKFLSGDDSTYLFINPVINGTEPTPDLTNTVAGGDLTTAGSIALRQGTAAFAPKLQIDGLRIGQQWVDVLPNSGIFQEYILTNTGTDILDSGANFNGKNFGNIPTNGTFILKGGKVKTWKNVPPDDITGARMFYRVYLQSATTSCFYNC